jgi:hypothetical protein
MTIPHTIELESGGAICASVVNGRVLLVVLPNATLTRAECEHVGDVLWQAGIKAEVIEELAGRAKPITSVDDERVKGAPPPPEPPPSPHGQELAVTSRAAERQHDQVRQRSEGQGSSELKFDPTRRDVKKARELWERKGSRPGRKPTLTRDEWLVIGEALTTGKAESKGQPGGFKAWRRDQGFGEMHPRDVAESIWLTSDEAAEMVQAEADKKLADDLFRAVRALESAVDNLCTHSKGHDDAKLRLALAIRDPWDSLTVGVSENVGEGKASRRKLRNIFPGMDPEGVSEGRFGRVRSMVRIEVLEP